MDQVCVYRYPASYAHEQDELDQYRASFRANIACKEAIEQSIRKHYCDNRLPAEAVQEVVNEFGLERVLYVLANTVQQKDWDGRFSPRNKSWAKGIFIPADNGIDGDRRRWFVVDQSHPGLTDLFLTLARHMSESEDGGRGE